MLASLEFVVLRWTDIAVAWLLTYLVHSTLILLATWVATSWKRMGDATHDLFWKTALVGGIVTASLQTAVAREPLAGQLRLAPRTAPSAVPAMRLAVRDGPPGNEPRVFFMRQRGTHWTPGVLILWLTTAGAGLLWLTAGHARTLRVLGGRTPLDATPIADRMRALLARAGVRRNVRLACSDHIASPVALTGDEVCLPRRALMELAPVEQDSMLAHEIAHLVRRDPQWLVAARAIEMVLFMQPLNRLARHRMQEVAEYLCDDWAVASTSHPVTLAKCLAAVAEWVGRAHEVDDTPRQHPMSAMVESGGSPLVRRVGRILGERSAPRARSTRSAFGVSVCALLLLAGAAPRISVGNIALPNQIRLVRALDVGAGPRAHDANALRGAVVGTARVTRVVIDTSVRWTRPLPPPDGAAAGARVTPMTAAERENIIILERRTDR